MKSVVLPRGRKEQGRTPTVLTRCHGVCKHFWGNTLRGPGECRLYGDEVKGDKITGCEAWTRRVAGVDPIPFGQVVEAPKPVEAAAPAPPPQPVAAAPKPPAPKPPRQRAPRKPPAPRPASTFHADQAALRAKHLAAIPGLVADGLTTIEIANRLGIGRSTANKYVRECGLKAYSPPPVNKGTTQVAERRARVAALLDEGCSGIEIIRRTGIPKKTVWNDIKALGRKPAKRSRRGANADEMEARKNRIAELAATGMQGREIADQLGITIVQLHNTASKHRIKIGTRGLGGRSRRDEVLALHFDGLDQHEIRKKLGCSKSTVSTILRKEGITEAPEEDPAERVAARQAQVKAMAAGGKRLAEMARATGVHATTIQRDLAALGITLPAGRPVRPDITPEARRAVASLRDVAASLSGLADAIERGGR